MNKKGFTLFTALVSFVLILLTSMLVQTMIKAERDRTEVISNIEEQAEMQAMADLARAEALQTFNYSIRKSIEDYFDSETDLVNPIEIYPQYHSFEEIKDDFSDRFLGADENSDKFVNEMAHNLVNSFPGKKFIGPYEISIELKGADATERQAIIKEGLKELYRHSIENGKFFEVVDCEEGNPEDCLGTFYLTLKTKDLEDEVYESLPQIKVKNYRTQRVLQESIFPKGNIKFYIPIRLFKVMAEARSLALEYGEETGNLWKNNYGLFSPRIHNEIEEMKLGICDPGYCNARDNPYIPPSEKNMLTRTCPNTSGFSYDVPVKCTSDLIARGICSGSGTVLLYNPNTVVQSDNQGNALEELVAKRLCYIAAYNIGTGKFLDQNPGDSLELVGNPLGEQQCSATTDNRISMTIISRTRNSAKNSELLQGTFSGVSTQTGFTGSYNANSNLGGGSPCPMTWSGNMWNTHGVGIDSNDKIIEKTKNDSSCLSYSTAHSNQYTTCSEISRIVVKISFRETDEKYIIDKEREPVYVVELIDNYFTPEDSDDPFHQNRRFEINNSNCGLKENPINGINQGCYASQWECKSYGPSPSNPMDMGGVPGADGTASGGCEVTP